MSESHTRGIALCDTSAVAPGEVLRVCLPGLAAIAVANVEGTFFAFADQCTHAAGNLTDGFVDHDVIVCPLHAGEFHIPSGKALDLPVTENLQTFLVWVDDARVMADLTQDATAAQV